MTIKCFWADPYLTSLETRVTAVRGTSIALAETIFYASAGGQERDQGTIAGIKVLEAVNIGSEVEYILAAGRDIEAGDTVVVKIDWNRRYGLMRMHSAAELVLQLMNRSYPGICKIGAHIAPEKARLDFEWPESLASVLPDLARSVNRIVDDNIVIVCGFSDEAQERRYWRIDGFEPVPCCGTHPRHTGEIGAIELRRKNIGKGKERIEITGSA